MIYTSFYDNDFTPRSRGKTTKISSSTYVFSQSDLKMVWMLHILLYDVFSVAARERLEGGEGGGGGG